MGSSAPRRRSLLALVLLGSLACGDDSTSMPDDAGEDGGREDGGLAAAAPAPPVFTPCASGFREVQLVELGVTVCEPWPESGRAACGVYEAHFPGEPGCVPVGTPCSDAERFAPDLPSDVRIHYVDPDAPAGGDGTAGAPYDSLASAVPVASAGEVIALAPGTYDAAPRLQPGVTLWGACPAETTLSPTTTSGFQAAVSSNGEITVRNLRIEGARPGIGALDVPERVILDGVWIEGTAPWAVVAANGGRVTVRASHLGPPRAASGVRPQHVLAQGAGRVDLERVAIVNPVAAGVTSEGDGSLVTLDHVVIRDSTPSGDGGRGIGVQQGGAAEVRASVIEDVSEIGVFARGAGCELLIEDSVIRRVRAEVDGEFGRAASTQQGARGTFRRVLVDQAVESGILSLEAEPLEVEDVVVRGIAPSPNGEVYGLGIAVTNSDLTLRRVIVTEIRAAAINLQGSVVAELADVRVVEAEGELALARFGRGLNAFLGATLTAERLSVSRVRDVGIYVTGATATISDLTIEDVSVQGCAETTCADSPGGVGLGVFAGASVAVERFFIARSDLAGVQVSGGDLLLRDGEIAENLIGANVQDGDFDLDRITSGVRYRDNGVNLDAQRLPVPDTPENPDF